jgi:hypothetical protein
VKQVVGQVDVQQVVHEGDVHNADHTYQRVNGTDGHRDQTCAGVGLCPCEESETDQQVDDVVNCRDTEDSEQEVGGLVGGPAHQPNKSEDSNQYVHSAERAGELLGQTHFLPPYR